jgi:hypothetical protein
MNEIFPIAAGIATALLVCTLVSPYLRTVLLIVSAVTFGILSSFVSGELVVSWAYPVFDIAQVLITALSSMAIITLWKRWLRLAR